MQVLTLSLVVQFWSACFFVTAQDRNSLIRKDLRNGHFRTILFHQSSPTTYLYILWVSILYKIQYDHLIPIEEINMTSNFDVTHISSKSMVLGDPGGVKSTCTST